MAQKRMFSKDVTNSDEFLDMSLSAQALYFHLGMNADDDGFVQPKSLMRLVQAKDEDIKQLARKGFIIPFHNSIIVITHWKVNNDIKKDRYKPTLYQEHLKSLGISDSKRYLDPVRIQSVSKVDTQYSIGKVSIGKVSIGESAERTTASPLPSPKLFFENSQEGGDERLRVVKELVALTGEDESSIIRETVKFRSYWTEPTVNQKKQRWQLEKTFEVKRRLRTWLTNAEKFNK